MRKTKKHMVENAEKALEEGGHPFMRPELGIKIIINAGPSSPPHGRPHKDMKAKHKKMKAKHKKQRAIGSMESALREAY